MIKKNSNLSEKKESRKRLKFLFKTALFIGVLFTLNYYHRTLLNYGVPVHFINALKLYLGADLFISFSRIVVVLLYERKHKLGKGIKNNFLLGINHIANILHTFILLASILLLFEIDPINLITSLSIVAAAIAILSKDYISNMINGMIIMFSDELTIGDEIKIGEIKGKIIDITLINIHLVNDDEDLIFIPNSLILTSQIFNYTKRSVRKVSFDFDLKNNLSTNVSSVEEYIKESLKEYHSYIKEESYNLRIIKINENFTSLKFQFVLHRQSSVREKDIRRVALRQVLKLIGEN